MRELLTQKEQRQLDILEYLFENPNWIHLDELSKIIGYNARIIKNDIKEIRHISPDFLIQYSTAGIMLVNEKNIGIEQIYRYFLQTSDYFNILKAFFFLEEPFTYEHLLQSLDISLPSLRKKVAEINRILHGNYRFKLKVTPTSIIGDEKDIRFFFSQYFHETYGFFHWPFSNFKEEDLENLISFFLNLTKFPAKYQNLYQIKMQTAVALHRIKTGHSSNSTANSIGKHRIYNQLNNFKNQLKDLSLNFGLELSPINIEEIFDSYTQTEFFFTIEEFLEARKTSKKIDRSYHTARDVLDNLTRQFEIQFSNTDELIWHLHNTALLERREINSESIISHNKSYTLTKIQKFFPNFYEATVIEMMRYKNSLKQKEKSRNVVHLVYTFFTHAEGLINQLFERKKRIKVLVLSEYDLAHPRFLISLYQFHTSNNIQYETWDKLTLDVNEIKETDYDAIITNFDINGVDNKRIINISRMPVLQVVNELNKISIQDL